MKLLLPCLALICAPLCLAAESLTVTKATVPLAPPGAMVHAAYMTIENTGETLRSVTGVSAVGYEMAHLHQTMEHDGVASMMAVHQLDIAPGASVVLEPGSFHVMLMHPKEALVEGETVPLELQFINGDRLTVDAMIKGRKSGS